jgi:hypothetical protein
VAGRPRQALADTSAGPDDAADAIEIVDVAMGPVWIGGIVRLHRDPTDIEFTIPRQIVADVVVHGAPTYEADGAISFEIEALTIEE